MKYPSHLLKMEVLIKLKTPFYSQRNQWQSSSELSSFESTRKFLVEE